MKALFVHPGPLLYTKVFLQLEPLGMELVAQAARRAGHAVRLIDLQVESHAAYHRFVAEWQPDLIAFSCNYLANVPEIIDLAKDTKAVLPRVLSASAATVPPSPRTRSSSTGRELSIACSRAKASRASLSCWRR